MKKIRNILSLIILFAALLLLNSCSQGKETSGELTPPQSLRIIEKGDTWLHLGWKDASENEDSYKIYRDGVEIAVLGPNTEEYNDTNIDFSVAHIYDIVACNGKKCSESSELEITTNSEQRIRIGDIEVRIPGSYLGNEVIIESVGKVTEDVGEYEIQDEGFKVFVDGADGEILDLPVEIKYYLKDNEESILMVYLEGIGWIPLMTLKDEEGNRYTYLKDFEFTINNTRQIGIIAIAKRKIRE